MHAPAKLDVKLICEYSVEVDSVTEYIVLSKLTKIALHIALQHAQ